MAMEPFLAMTAAEIAGKSHLPPKIGWMACHFSPYGLGLSNLPVDLPAGSILMVDDSTPIRRHNPQMILEQLAACCETLSCSAVLMDFQRPDVEETARLVRFLSEGLSCPAAVSHFYADACSCAVCIPPVPPSTAPQEHFSRWKGRELWLELTLEAEQVTVTAEGASTTVLPGTKPLDTDFFSQELFCHYRQSILPEAVKFTLYRTAKDLACLLEEAESHGVTRAIGLYQEFRKNENRPANAERF